MENKLFGSLVYSSHEEYITFLKDLDQPKAVAMLVAAAAFAQSKGIYSMQESEVIINSIRQLLPAGKIDEMLQDLKKEEGAK